MHEKILVKSENCINELERWKRNDSRSYMSPELLPGLTFSGIALLIIILQMCGTIKSSNIAADIVMFGSVIIAGYFSKKLLDKSAEINNEYNKFRNCCDNELLIVYQDKIHGRNIDGEITLLYSQIDRVSDMSYKVDEASPKFSHSSLIIVDTVGNTYQFDSFKNVKDIAFIINDILSKKENENETV